MRVRSFILSGARHPVLICCTTALRIRKCRSRFAREFGKQVADIVMEVTDDKTLPKDERKRKQIETAPKKSREAKLIKLADKPAIFEPSRPVQLLTGRLSGDWNISNGPRTLSLDCEECRLGSNSNSTRLSQLPGGRSIHRWLVGSRK
jgi:hypothetical protein